MNWKGLIAAILAVGLSLTLVIGITAAAWSGRPLGKNGGEVLIGIFVAMGAAISAYLASKNNT